MRQTFAATEVSISDPGELLMVAFGTIDPDQGTTHSLLFLKDEEVKGPKSIYVEFNDQINASWGPELQSVELRKDALIVRWSPHARMKKGKVDDLSDDPLFELEVGFAHAPERHSRMEAVLEELLREGCGLSRPT